MQGEQPIERQFGDLSVTQLIVMAGLPGAGKSTIGEIVGARLGATVVSVDPIESAILRAGIDADQPTVSRHTSWPKRSPRRSSTPAAR